jgi:hypothetical protein
MTTYKDERGSTVSTAKTEKVVEISSVEARQGGLGRPVLMVLIGGLVLAAIAWAFAGQYGEGLDKDTSSKQLTTDSEAVVKPSNETVIDNTPPEGQTVPTDRRPTAGSGTGGG